MNESRDVFYLQQISADLNNQVFKCPWGGIVIKNSDERGRLLHFKSKDEYNHAGKKLWLYLALKIFRHEGELHNAYCCNECEIMKGVQKLKLDSDPELVQPLLCFHAKTAEFLIPNWQDIWNVEIPNLVSFYNPKFNQDVNFHKFTGRDKNTTFLVGVWVDNAPHLIVTVTKRQYVPFCSTCDSTTCPHHKAFESRQKEINQPLINFMCRMDLASVEIEQNTGDDELALNNDDDEDVIDPTVGEEATEIRHYLDLPPLPLYHKMYGYNFSPILYPFDRSEAQQETWLKRVNNIYDFPEKFVPVWSLEKKCQHGDLFDDNDSKLFLESETILVYNNIGEQVFNVKNYVRKTVSSCKCVMRYDGHPELLWNLGGGRFVNYTLLNNYLHTWKNDGLPMYALYKGILEMCSSSKI